MKNNQPVTQHEHAFPEGAILASRTDLKGIVTYANQAFIDISGFSQEELIGRNHNVVRHPDMPPEAFQDLWDTVKADRPWTGIVKNRCKNGDHYWVKATVTPVRRDGRVTEYMSVRVAPSRAEISAAETLYRDINAGRASLRRSAPARLAYKLRSLPIARRLAISYGALVTLIATLIIGVGMLNMQASLDTNERRDLREHYQAVQDKLRAETRLAAAMATLVSELPAAQRAFADGDRDALMGMFREAFLKLKKKYGVREMQFHTPPAFSFLRIHKPGKFGDDLSGKRPTIVKTNADKATVTGVDIGPYGLGLRGIVPMMHDGIHRGSIEFGMAFDGTFFEDFKQRYGVDLSLDLYREGRLVPFASTLPSALPVSEADIERVRAGDTVDLQTEQNGRPIGVLRAPLNDFANQVIGMLQVVVDRTDYVAQAEDLRNNSIITALVALVIGLLVSWLIARSITRPLTRAVDTAQRITDGDYGNDIAIDREDETGHLLMTMLAMQSRLHYDLHTVQEALRENMRVRAALDSIETPVTLSDHHNHLFYMNVAAKKLFDQLGAGISGRANFDADDLLGTSLADFFSSEKLRRAYATEFHSTTTSEIETQEHTLKLVSSPIRDDGGSYQGRVTQWLDITAELAEQRREQERVTEERRAAAANLRLKVALDNVSSNVMVADADHQVIYMNDTALKMFSNAEADIRRDISGFDAANIVGANIDIFHRNPRHQRQMLDNMQGTHNAGFEVGGRSMHFVANPVVDPEGQRLGTVVEWTDRTAEVAVEREIDGIVEAAGNGDLARRIELDGKTGFFLQLGNGINALIERMEAVFTDIARVMGNLAEGDLRHPITTDYAGTFGAVKGDVNTTLENLQQVMMQLRDSANAITSGSVEISSGNTNLSARTEQQASSLEETASSMEELTSTVRHNADSAQQANQLATNAQGKAEEGGEVVREAMAAMEAINNASGSIAEIIGVIDEIAFQTNLLALNASVEAARAGEQGRGFAVVATEVRNLAGRSAAAAREIKSLIQDSVQKVQAGSELVTRSGGTLEEIVGSVKKVRDIVAEIAAASAQQSAGIDQVNQAVTSMDEAVQQNAALAEETSAASASLNEKAQDMHGLMSFFKVEGVLASPTTAAPSSVAPTMAQPAAEARPATPQAAPAGRQARPAPLKAAPVEDDDEWAEF